MKKYFILILFLVYYFLSFSQDILFKFDSLSVIERIKYDVQVLAADSMEGREIGTRGEKKAAEYIKQQFIKIGLTPAFDSNTSYFQKIEYTYHIPFLSGENYCIINNKKFTFKTEWAPAIFSSNNAIEGEIVNLKYGIVSDELNYDDYKEKYVKDKIAVIDIGYPPFLKEKNLDKYNIQERLKKAVNSGVKGIILISNDNNNNIDTFSFFMNNHNLNIFDYNNIYGIPIIIAKGALRKMLTDASKLYAKIKTDVTYGKTYGYNVGAFIDNASPYTVVIGAHYDHLGIEINDGNIDFSNIYNGADDNASGVAAILELARKIKNSDLKSNNYLFIAFSGEEKGFIGSRRFIESKKQEISKINYMLNFDMVGRLTQNERTLVMYGCNTSEIWDIVLNQLTTKNIKPNCVNTIMGASDHVIFYLNEIPAIHLFTDLHSDYHKPTDDVDKLDYNGIRDVVNFAYEMIAMMEKITFEKYGKYHSKIPFQKAKMTTTSRRNLKTSLGIVPDHSYNGMGIKIMSVKDGQIGEKIGLKENDIIVEIDGKKVENVNTYMEILNSFENLENVEIKILRGKKTKTMKIRK